MSLQFEQTVVFVGRTRIVSRRMSGEALAPSKRPFHAIIRGALGFATVSVAAFSVWAFAGKWVSAFVGEIGLYGAVAFVFIVLSGLLLNGLVPGPLRILWFYRVFAPAFLAYAATWCALWFWLRFGLGEWLGSLGGSLAFCLVVAAAFRNFAPLLASTSVLFVTHSAGYFLGAEAMAWVARSGDPSDPVLSVASKLAWGLLYGLGFGSGLGYAFFTFQRPR